jgi:preprotein translocase subunit SecF
MPEDDALRPLVAPRPNVLVRVRVPLWLVLAVVVALIVVALILIAGKSSVNLGQGVDGASKVEVTITLCNQTVDTRKVDVRKAELDFEQALRNLGAKEATVRIDRPEPCPTTTVPPVTVR